MDVFWLEQIEFDVPAESTWLSERERAQSSGMHIAKRQADWQLGRWTAKQAVAACLELPAHLHELAKIEIRPSASGAPEVFFANKPAPISVSISHCAGIAVCAVALSSAALGCDLETVEPRSEAFASDYFSTEEQELAAQATENDRSAVLTLLWSAKESALKALHTGLRLDTRSLRVTLADPIGRKHEDGNDDVQKDPADNSPFGERHLRTVRGWHALRVDYVGGQTFYGWWQHTANLVRTLAATPPPTPPIFLKISRDSTKREIIRGAPKAPRSARLDAAVESRDVTGRN